MENVEGTWTCERVLGTEVELRTLKPNQRVAWGDGETYYLLYTMTAPPPATGTLEEANAIAVARKD